METKKMREALCDIETRAANALANQTNDEAENHRSFVAVLVGIENRARSATWGEVLP